MKSRNVLRLAWTAPARDATDGAWWGVCSAWVTASNSRLRNETVSMDRRITKTFDAGVRRFWVPSHTKFTAGRGGKKGCTFRDCHCYPSFTLFTKLLYFKMDHTANLPVLRVGTKSFDEHKDRMRCLVQEIPWQARRAFIYRKVHGRHVEVHLNL